MPTTLALMSCGVNAEAAKRLGYNGASQKEPNLLTGVGTTQSGAAVIRKDTTWIRLVTAGGATAAILPADAEYMQGYFIQVVTGGTTGLVFPPVGAAINAVADNGSVNVAAELPRLFFRVAPLLWASFLAA